MTATTAACIRRDFLEPSLEAQAFNAGEERLIVNLSPECDSILEHGQALLKIVGPAGREHLVALLRLVAQVAHLNRAERECVRKVAGAADDLTRDLRNQELNGGRGRGAGGYRPVAAALKQPLAVLSDVDPEVVAAVRAVDAVIASTPAALLMSDAVRRELRERKSGTLLELYTTRSELG